MSSPARFMPAVFRCWSAARVVTLAAVIGVTLGLLAGFFKQLDTPIARLVDAMMAFPDILLAIALVAALGPSLTTVIIALSIVYAPRLARIVRASTLVIRELPYVEAARALGVSTLHIMTRHVLRNLLSPILVQGTFLFANAMLAEAGLSFLGLGVSPDIPTWGTMIAAGRQYLDQANWMTLFPGFAIILSVLSAADGRRRIARHSRSQTSKGLVAHVFRISSARATRRSSARAISRRCSNRSRKISSGGAC